MHVGPMFGQLETHGNVGWKTAEETLQVRAHFPERRSGEYGLGLLPQDPPVNDSFLRLAGGASRTLRVFWGSAAKASQLTDDLLKAHTKLADRRIHTYIHR